MSEQNTNSGGGSILFKIGILVLIAILVAVVTIPKSIWQEEEDKKQLARVQMEYLYQASLSFYASEGRYPQSQTELNALLRDSLHVKTMFDSLLTTEDVIKTVEGYVTLPFLEKQVEMLPSAARSSISKIHNSEDSDTFQKMDVVIEAMLKNYLHSGKILSCPVTTKEYIFQVKDKPARITIKSPISPEEPVSETYGAFPLFSYNFENPGYIEDGDKYNWKN
ncbi:MAG: hypothetical protein DWQ06_09950 [Calditrichaeota bacterium]|nr:MAG: hypothetical protein DWQ06_09950 [Calditrichota bacterium]